MGIGGRGLVRSTAHRAGLRIKAVLPHQLVSKGEGVTLKLKGAQAFGWGRTGFSRAEHHRAGSGLDVPAGLVGAVPPRGNSPDMTVTPATLSEALRSDEHTSELQPR